MAEPQPNNPANQPIDRAGETSFPPIDYLKRAVRSYEHPFVVKAGIVLAIGALTTAVAVYEALKSPEQN